MYTIVHYSDLDEALGSKWFIRGLNESGDFCYAILGTVRFYLRERPPLKDYIPSKDGVVKQVVYSQGHSLVFIFIRGDGVSSDFSKIYSLQ